MRHLGKKKPAVTAAEAAARWLAPVSKALAPIWAGAAACGFVYLALSQGPSAGRDHGLVWLGGLSVVLSSQALCIWKLARDKARLKADLTMSASHDPLTGALSPTRLAEETEREIRLAQRKGSELAVVALRIENLMEINQKFGREEGDKALYAMSLACQESLRDTDFFGRLNGLVFCATLPATSGRQDEAGVAMGRLREAANQIRRSHELGEIRPVVRVGLAVLESGDTAGTLLARAAAELDAAQTGGARRSSDRGEAPAR